MENEVEEKTLTLKSLEKQVNIKLAELKELYDRLEREIIVIKKAMKK
jgi:hypothetical protein